MSKPTRNKLQKKSEPSRRVVSEFFSKDEGNEPVPKKMKKSSSTEKPPQDDDPNDSLRFFKTLKPRVKSTVEPKPSTSNAATDFIDMASNSKKPTPKRRAKAATTSKAKKRKPKDQADIRKVLSKQEQLFNHVVSENCLQEGIDPEEMQLALAISESLKDQSKAVDSPEASSSSSSSKFENPCTSGKVLPISAVLERYGFKCKKNYSEYELDMITNSHVSKRSKFQKWPTALTRTSNEQRNKMIERKIKHVLKGNLSSSVSISDDSAHDYEVFGYNLKDHQNQFNTVFDIHSESRHTDEVLMRYYVAELFEPSFVRADALLKDWSKIPGRDPSPDRKAQVTASESESTQEEKVEQRHVTDDIAEDDKEFTSNEVQAESENDSKISCADIFADLEDFDIELDDTEVNQSHFKESSEELAGHLDILRVKLSQSYMEVDRGDRHNISFHSDSITVQAENFLPSPADEWDPSEADQIDLTQLESDEILPTVIVSDDVTEARQPEKLNEVDLTNEESCDPPLKSYNTSGSFVAIASSQIDLTQEEIDISGSSAIPYDDSYYSLQQHMKKLEQIREGPKIAQAEEGQQASPIQIDLVSSDEDGAVGFQMIVPTQQSSQDEVIPVGTPDVNDEVMNQTLSQNSLEDDDDLIEISDEEVNFSMRKYHNNNHEEASGSINEEVSDTSSEARGIPDSVDLTQDFEPPSNDPELGFLQFEINNIEDQSLADVMDRQEELNIDDTISNLLETSVRSQNVNVSTKTEATGWSDSILEIMKKYGEPIKAPEKKRSIRKMQSDSLLVNEVSKRRKSVHFNLDGNEDIVDLSQELDEDEEMKENSFHNSSIHQSLENILKSPVRPPRKQLQVQRGERVKGSFGVQIDCDYLVDTESVVPEPDFKNMTPVELKQALFKYGIRPLPVKKAISLLEFIYDQLNPKIRVAADEEIDINDSRRVMNITDIATNIGAQEDDCYPFQLGLVDDEEVVLPKVRKSKLPTCAIPLHISFYNMVRSNEKIQKFVLEFRPIEIDQVHKHFRKFGLSYQLNDIIAFLDRRCITFKTQEKSYSKVHEQKKQKRAMKSQNTASQKRK